MRRTFPSRSSTTSSYQTRSPPGKHRVPVSHQLKIGPVVAGDILDATGELLPTGKQLLQVAETARHRFAPHVDDFGVRHHEMDQPDVAEVVRHLVDEEWLMPTVSARVRPSSSGTPIREPM